MKKRFPSKWNGNPRCSAMLPQESIISKHFNAFGLQPDFLGLPIM
jgi:hypothetical protein